MLEPGISYAIVKSSDDEFINHLVYKYIKHINEEAGYHFGKSLIGRYFLIDDKEIPKKDKYHVISFKKRSEKDLFTEVNLDKRSHEILLSVFGIENADITNYVVKYLSRRKSADIIPYLHFYKNTGEDFKSFKEAVGNNLFGGVHYKNKVIAVIKAISTASPANVMKLYDVIKRDLDNGESFESFIYFISHVINMDSIPEYIDKEVHLYLNREYYSKLVKLMISLSTVNSVEGLLNILLE